MMSKISGMLCAAICWMTFAAIAQPVQQRFSCGTDAQADRDRKQFPQVTAIDAQLEADIRAQLSKMDLRRFAKTTTGSLQDSLDAVVYDVPVVFHIVHNYGAEDVPDASIYAIVRDMNRRFLKQNPDTSYIIPQYQGEIIASPPSHQRYIAKGNIRFHPATKDTAGNPTHGITRNRSYLTSHAGDEGNQHGPAAPLGRPDRRPARRERRTAQSSRCEGEEAEGGEPCKITNDATPTMTASFAGPELGPRPKRHSDRPTCSA